MSSKRGREDALDSEEDVWGADLMGDEEDRARLAGMKMLERETEMDRRRTLRQRVRERNEARRRLERKEGGDRVGKRGKTEDLVTERDARMESYLARERTQAGLEEEEDEEEEDAEEGEVGDMDVDEDDATPVYQDAGSPVALSEVLKIQARRSTLVSWQDKPFFEKTVRGMYIKVRLGESGGKGVYRMALVRKVERRATSYKLIGEITADKSNVHLVCAIGHATKRFKLIQVSNQEITPQEFKVYTRKQSDDDLQPPGELEIARKLRDVQQAVEYRRSEKDLEEKLKANLDKPLADLTDVQLKDKRTETEGLMREARDNKDRAEMTRLAGVMSEIRDLLEERNPTMELGPSSSGMRYNKRVKAKRMDPKTAAEYYADDDPTKANPFRRRRTVSSAMIVQTNGKEEVGAVEDDGEGDAEAAKDAEGAKEQPPVPQDEDVAGLQRCNVVVKRLGKSPKALAAQIAAEHDFELDIDI